MNIETDIEYLSELAVRLDKTVPKVSNDMAAVDALRDASNFIRDVIEMELEMQQLKDVIASTLVKAITEDCGNPNCPIHSKPKLDS